MSRGPLVQVVLFVCGVLTLLVLWDERKHTTALVWAAGWTACCWLLVTPGWARWAMLAATGTAMLVMIAAAGNGRGQPRSAHVAERTEVVELLLAGAEREQWTTISMVPARLRAYTNATRLIATRDLDTPLPPPPSEPRPGPEGLWRALDDAYHTAVAVAVTAGAGLAARGAVRKALRRVAAAADQLATAIDTQFEARLPVAGPVQNPWLPAGERTG